MDQIVHDPIPQANGVIANGSGIPQHLIHTQHHQYQLQQQQQLQLQHLHQQQQQQHYHPYPPGGMPMFPRQNSFPPQARQGLPHFASSGANSGHQTPIHSSTPILAMGSNSMGSNSNNMGSQGYAPRFSRTPSPSPNRSRAHSPPGITHPNSSFSSGRLSPVSLFQGTQSLFDQGDRSQSSSSSNNINNIRDGSASSVPNYQYQQHNLASTPNYHSNASPSSEFFSQNDGSKLNSAINTPQSISGRWPSFSTPHHQHQMQYPQFDQTPLSIPQTLFLEQMDSPHPPGFGPPPGNRDSHYGSFAPSPAVPFHQQHQQRVGRPLSTHMGPPVVAPLPSRQRLLGQGQLSGQGFTPTFNPHHITGGDISQHGTPTGVRSQPTFAPPPPPPIKRQDSDENQSGVLKVPPGYFPIFNGSEWVLISHAAANIAGIPIPAPQSSPSHNAKDGNIGSLSRASSPSTHTTLRRQASEIGHGAKQGTDMRRTDSESRRGSLPSSLSRTGSPSDFKSSKSPGSPNFHNTESSTAVQENLDFLDLLQRYEYLSAWARQGKSKTPSETGSPIDGGAQKRLEPFEKSLVLKEITEWIEEHKDYLLREKQDLFLPSQIDFGNINPNADKTVKILRIENHGPRIVQLRPLQMIPNAYDQLGPLFKETLIVYPANGTEPMFANIDIGLKTGANLGFFSSWLLILVNESSLIGRKITWNVTNNTQIDREMDPYAKTYTPQWLRNLNTVKSRMVITGEQASTIDFGAYLEANDHPCYKQHNGKFSLEPPKVESLEVILPGQVSIDLSADSYASRFHPLLRVEQYLINEDVSTYNLYMVELRLADAASNYFQFQVNGLSEQCPMLLRGDSVTVRQVTNGIFSGIEYKTFVHGTNNRTNSVYVHLPMGALPSLAQERWNIQFKVSNSRIKEMYRAVGGIQEFLGYHPRDPAQDTGDDDDSKFYSARTFLFPTIQDTKPKTKLPSINLGFVDAALNWEQKSAVQSIVRNDYGPIPFIISGPPGTGKTKTLAETALQILINDTQCHILITAPSNSACDTLISRLIPFLGTQYLFRLNHPSRTFAEVPTAIMPYCYGELHFDLPPLDELLKFRIVVCTCVDAGLLISAGASNQSLHEYLPHKGFTSEDEPLRSHWTHLLIDEAGQAIEPETDIPLLCVLDECEDPPQIVLCGDHNQLGPKTFLPELQLSFLERLATTIPLYCDHPQSRKFARSKASAVVSNSKETALLEKTIPAFANLVQNYRSHPKMLMMPSAMFYNNTLIASGEKRVINSMLGCELLPNPDCPIAFVGVNGIDTSHLGEAVSWRNELEADKVAEVIQRLLRSETGGDDEGLNVKVTDIGVIAPFREQVKHLRQVLRAKGFAGVNVGTVEVRNKFTKLHCFYLANQFNPFSLLEPSHRITKDKSTELSSFLQLAAVSSTWIRMYARALAWFTSGSVLTLP
ncbi:MAG: hypothetical protein BYD32DRAFT_11800 [Podila humilis]|nr:MAG: hypothetical protein BYD32DRAFT_11800 [Podila humilis]